MTHGQRNVKLLNGEICKNEWRDYT